jgi:stage II sporulation protein AA (anti-sigma F factor antagonist)
MKWRVIQNTQEKARSYCKNAVAPFFVVTHPVKNPVNEIFHVMDQEVLNNFNNRRSSGGGKNVEIATYRIRNFLWIQVPEELDQHVADIIRKKCEIILLDQKIKSIVFDFSKTVFMDSSGVGMVMGRYRQVTPTGGRVYAYQPSGRVLRILKISGLMRIVQVCRNKDEMELVIENHPTALEGRKKK